MQARPLFRLFSGLLLAASVPALAATQNVTVLGGASMAFSPKTVVINAGDSVTFSYAGGQLQHNVAADNGSFRCAKGCDDTGGNGTPSSSAWSFTRTFNSAGTFGYYCEVHGGPGGFGMAGSIVVNDVAPPPPQQPIVGGISGNWFDPSANQGGHGFQFEVLPGNGMLAIWFVFSPDGTQQSWIYSQGSYEPGSNDATLPAFLEQGGAFPPNFDGSKITVPAWGLLEFKFSDCNNGSAEYTPNEAALNAGYGHVTFPIQRVTSIAGTSCP